MQMSTRAIGARSPRSSYLRLAVLCVAGGAAHLALRLGTQFVGEAFVPWQSVQKGASIGRPWSATERGEKVLRRAGSAVFVHTGTQSSPQALPPGTKIPTFHYVQHRHIPSGKGTPEMTDEEGETWLQERCAELNKLMPLTDEELADEVDELKWKWGHELLPFDKKRRKQIAAHKARTILRQKELFKTIRLFHPIALKHPTLLKTFVKKDIQDLECLGLKVNPHWLHNEEKKAGFTYEEWAKATDGATFTEWAQPKVGDIVEATVVAMNQDGAFFEIGAKSWAFMPLAEISLKPLGTPSEALKMGELVNASIVAEGASSVVYGDSQASQYVLSRTKILKEQAKLMIEGIMLGDGSVSSMMEVEVLQLRPYGAVVRTEEGLEGLIPNRELADKQGDSGIVGTKIKVVLQSVKREDFDKPGSFPLTFTYKGGATMELARKLTTGTVVDCRVAAIREGAIDVIVDDSQVTIVKSDLSNAAMNAWELTDVFAVDMDIKALVRSTNPVTGEVRLSIACLEKKKGQLLKNPARVFRNAEKVAARWMAGVEKEMSKFERALEGDPSIGGLGPEDDGDDDAVF